MNISSTITEVIIVLEQDYENANYESVINLYEEKGRVLFESFITKRIDNLNFFDMILISYRKMGLYEKAFSIISIQVHKLMQAEDMNENEINERLSFYCLLHAEMAKEKGKLMNEYIALECMEKLSASNAIYSKRMYDILKQVHTVYVDRAITTIFVLFILEIIFIKFYPKLILPLITLMGIIYLYASWQLKDFDIKVSELLIKFWYRFTLPNSMKQIKSAMTNKFNKIN